MKIIFKNTYIYIYIAFIITVKRDLESRLINEIKEKSCGIWKPITPPFLFFCVLCKKKSPNNHVKVLSEKLHQLGCNSPITGAFRSFPRDRVQRSWRRAVRWLLFAWCPKIPVPYQASILTQSRLHRTEWAHKQKISPARSSFLCWRKCVKNTTFAIKN